MRSPVLTKYQDGIVFHAAAFEGAMKGSLRGPW
jgi:hypothetical protein